MKINKKFILGKKLNMTQLFDENGVCYPATLVSAGPVVVTAKMSKDKNGYEALQVGYEAKNLSKTSKPVRGHLAKNLGAKAAGFTYLQEYKGGDDLSIGDVVDVSSFEEGEKVTVAAVSKGKGFQSVIKRHGFKGGPRSHGQKHSENAPGSIGGGLRTHVPKGMRMAGRMGSDRTTVKGLKVLKIDKENNVMLILGAIPGRRGTLVEIYK